MMFLICLLFTACSYASETIPLLKKVPLYKEAKKNYKSYSKEIYYPEENCDVNKVCFYNPLTKSIEIFDSNKIISTIFEQNIFLIDIIKSNSMKNFCEKYNSNVNLNLFFQNIDNFSWPCNTESCNAELVYNLKFLLYQIISSTETLEQRAHFNVFLTCFQKDVLYYYNQAFELMPVGSASITCLLSVGVFSWAIFSPTSFPSLSLIDLLSCGLFAPFGLGGVAAGFLYAHKKWNPLLKKLENAKT